MSNFKCEFCDSSFLRKNTLINHQKTAKFCLDIQGKDNLKNRYIEKICTKIYVN